MGQPASHRVQILPQDSLLTSIVAEFTPSISAGTLNPLTVDAALFTADSESSIFTRVPGANCQFAPYAGTIGVGDSRSCALTGLAVAIDQGTRAIIVFSMNIAGLPMLTSIVGQGSASLVFK